MINELDQYTENLKFNNTFLTSLLLGGELSDKSIKTSLLSEGEMSGNNSDKKDNTDIESDLKLAETGDLELIYANEGDSNYDSNIDTNRDSKISYKEYLRYCEKNSRLEEKRSDTKISEDKRQFTTYSFGHATNAYNKTIYDVPEGKVVSKA